MNQVTRERQHAAWPIPRLTSRLRDALVQFRAHDDALLLVRVGPGPHEDGRDLATIDRHMRHPGRDVEEVAGPGHLAMFQAISRPELYLVAADKIV